MIIKKDRHVNHLAQHTGMFKKYKFRLRSISNNSNMLAKFRGGRWILAREIGEPSEVRRHLKTWLGFDAEVGRV